MKRFLSILLSVLMVMSTMSMVAFADAPATITFDTDLRDVPAGTKIAVNTGDVAEGQTVVTTINGVESATEMVNGEYVVTIPESYQEVTVSVKEGDTVVAKTATIEFYGLTAGEGTVMTDANWESVTDSSTADEFSAQGIKGAEPKDGIDAGRSTIITEGTDKKYKRINWGTAVSDPTYTTSPTTAAANGANNALTSTAGDNTAVAVVSFDFKYDALEVINAETGAVEKTITISEATTEDRDNLIRVADSTIMVCQAVVDNTRNHNSVFEYDSYTNKMLANVYGDNGEKIQTPLDVNVGEWHTYKAIYNVPANTMYVYVDGVIVGSGKIMTKENSESIPTSIKWPYTYGIRPLATENVRVVSLEDDFVVTYYGSYADKAEASVELGTPVTDRVPAGSKVDIGLTASNLKYNQRAVVYANGVETAVASDGTITLGEGYTSVYAAVLDSKGAIVKDNDGDEIKSEEIVFYGVTLQNATQLANINWDDADEYKEGVFDYAGVGFTNVYSDYKTVSAVAEKTTADGTNKYLQVSVWGADGIPAGSTATAKYLTTSLPISGVNGSTIVSLEADCKFEKYWHTNTTTSEITEYPINSCDSLKAAFSDANGASLLNQTTGILSLECFYDGTTYKQTQVFIADKTTGKMQACVFDESGTIVKTPLDINPGEWHTYKMVADATTNTLWLYVDDVLVASGKAYVNSSNTAQVATSFRNANIRNITAYDADGGMAVNFDNVVCDKYTSVASAPTDAFVDATANGIGLVPANLDAEDKVADMAIIARAADGSVQVQKYNALTSTDTYKYFTFTKPAKDIFIWNWETLKPLVIPFTPAQ